MHQALRLRMGVYRPSVPVISVGNIVVGGTGKTPTVIALLKWLRAHFPVLAEPGAIAVLSRGYGRTETNLVVVDTHSDYLESGDEPLLIKQSCEEATVAVHGKRSMSAWFSERMLKPKLFVLDDGFQHLALARDLNLVLLDATNPLGNGRLLPAGPLRESPEALKRADAVVLIDEPGEDCKRLILNLDRPVIQFQREMILPGELSTDLSTPIWLLTSIARPNRLYNQLIERKVRIVGHSRFPDHHRYTDSDLAKVVSSAASAGAKLVITTAKDRVRIRHWPDGFFLKVIDLQLHCATDALLRSLVEPLLKKVATG